MKEHLILSFFNIGGRLVKQKFKNFSDYNDFKLKNKYSAEEIVSMIHEGNGLYRDWDGEWDIFEHNGEDPITKLSRFLKSLYEVKNGDWSYYLVSSNEKEVEKSIRSFFAAVYPKATINMVVWPKKDVFVIYLEASGEIGFNNVQITFQRENRGMKDGNI